MEFYKTWGEWGALANFSPHPIRMPEGPGDQILPGGNSAAQRSWPTVEHYYQAQKFAGARCVQGALSGQQEQGLPDRPVPDSICALRQVQLQARGAAAGV